jgi:asparagine synthase (glutamine-hydrolysing)
MCGLAGFVDFSGKPASHWTPVLEQMYGAIAHRGPDGWGRTIIAGDDVVEASARGTRASTLGRTAGATVGLAHARLAIIDLSEGGHQPMATADRSGWLVYNGEIYNYAALRDALAARGTPPRTSSDTETLVEWLALEGPTALTRLRGMFAFAWWDERAQRLLLARDRFGIKPLVYAQPSPGVWLFASEPRALMASGLVGRRARAGGAAEFLARGSIDPSAGFWQDVDNVLPGKYVEITAGGVNAASYWDIEQVLLAPSQEAAVEQVATAAQRAIVGAVEAHLVSDVPVAIFLSGGIDSTAVLAAARAVTSAAIQTFTVSIPGSPLDEASEARAIAHHFRSEHREVGLDTTRMDEAIEEFFAAMQTPSVDGFNTFLVARAARNAGVKVALSGVGGDELFGGYDSFVTVPRVAALSSGLGPLRPAAARALQGAGSRRAIKLGDILAAAPQTITQTWREYRRVLGRADVAGLVGAQASLDGEMLPPAAPFSAIRALETRHFLVPQLLPDTDAFTMCRALEMRTPLVDHEVFEAVARAGVWRRTRGASYKQTLFHALPALTVPGGVERPKRGFVLPFDVWLRDALLDPGTSKFRDFSTRLRGQPRYATFVQRFLGGRLHWSRLWAIYVLDRMTEGEWTSPS